MGLGFKLEVDEKVKKDYTQRVDINVLPMYDDVVIPQYESDAAVGMDLHAYLTPDIVNESGESAKVGIGIQPHKTVMIGTGIKLEIPAGVGGFIFARSGLSSKKGLAPANKVGIVDPDYRGEIKVALHNHSDSTVMVEHGDRIAQIAFMPYLIANLKKVDTLSETKRNDGGFGHSGK